MLLLAQDLFGYIFGGIYHHESKVPLGQTILVAEYQYLAVLWHVLREQMLPTRNTWMSEKAFRPYSRSKCRKMLSASSVLAMPVVGLSSMRCMLRQAPLWLKLDVAVHQAVPTFACLASLSLDHPSVHTSYHHIIL